jgi:hypothetical protein
LLQKTKRILVAKVAGAVRGIKRVSVAATAVAEVMSSVRYMALLALLSSVVAAPWLCM